MSTERDAGLAALQKEDVPTAIALLEAATRQDPNDYEAFLFLGAAYGNAERHMDAVRVLTQAAQLEPANSQARYNLGIAMEQAGYREQALQEIQQALLLQPDYPKAQEALKRLQVLPPLPPENKTKNPERETWTDNHHRPPPPPPPSQVCKEANEALIYGLIGLFCCGFVAPVGIYKGMKAQQIIAANPNLTGGGMAMAGIIIGILGTICNLVIGPIFLLIWFAQMSNTGYH